MARFLNSVLVAVLYASALVSAAPWSTASKHATHRVRSVGKRDLEIETFAPAASFKVFLSLLYYISSR